MTGLRSLRTLIAGMLVLTFVALSVRSFLDENLGLIQRAAAEPFQSYDRKVDFRWADFSRQMRFIAERTPEDAVILFPTGGKEGPIIGRRSLAAYFLFPRTVISGDAKDVAERRVTHVVMADGAPSFAVPGERAVFRAGRITDETVAPLKGQRDIRLIVFSLRMLDEQGTLVQTLEFPDASSPLARRTGGRATRESRAHEVISVDGRMGELFDFRYREPTDFDVWRLPIDLEIPTSGQINLELVYALAGPGVSLALESGQSGGALTIVEPLVAAPETEPRTLRISDLARRFRERAEVGRGSAPSGRIRFEARLLFTPSVGAVYPDAGLIHVEMAR